MKKIIFGIFITASLAISSWSYAITQNEVDEFLKDLESRIILRDIEGIMSYLEEGMNIYVGSLSSDPVFNRESYRAYTIDAFDKMEEYDYKILGSTLNKSDDGYTLDLIVYEESVIDGQSFSHTLEQRLWIHKKNGKIIVSRILLTNYH